MTECSAPCAARWSPRHLTSLPRRHVQVAEIAGKAKRLVEHRRCCDSARFDHTSGACLHTVIPSPQSADRRLDATHCSVPSASLARPHVEEAAPHIIATALVDTAPHGRRDLRRFKGYRQYEEIHLDRRMAENASTLPSTSTVGTRKKSC